MIFFKWMHSNFSSKNTGISARLFRIFVSVIIFPTILIWMIYLFYLNTYFIKDTISVQQTYLQNSLAPLELSCSNVSTIFTALEGIPEFTYYLDYYSDKRDMLYSLKKTIQSQCTMLKDSSGIVDHIKIYSSNPSLLFSDPFHHIDELNLDQNEWEILQDMTPGECMWHVISNSNDTTEIPVLRAYQKLYAYKYVKVIGYIEMEITSRIMESFINQFNNNKSIHNGNLALYQNNRLIYSSTDPLFLPDSQTLSSFSQDGYKLSYRDNCYVNYVTIPDLNLQLVVSGEITSLSHNSGNSMTVIITLFIGVLLILFLRFFRTVTQLSKQIIDFSSHIRHSDPDELKIYSIEHNHYHEIYTELLDLITSYNSLIQDKSTLMSQVRKMELLSQDASYQALQSQIHPHFIYGTLENIRMLALQNRDKDVADMIFSLSTLLRHSLSISTKAVSLREELDVSTHYLKIQETRFGNRLSHRFLIDESLLDMQLPAFICQPILENSILYGVSQTFDTCDLEISAYRNDTHVVLELSNSGIYITEERLIEINELMSDKRDLSTFQGRQNGFALYNIKERLRIFYKGKASIHMELSDSRTKTIIRIERSFVHVSHTDC